jgi:hypothetical protein
MELERYYDFRSRLVDALGCQNVIRCPLTLSVSGSAI